MTRLIYIMETSEITEMLRDHFIEKGFHAVIIGGGGRVWDHVKIYAGTNEPITITYREKDVVVVVRVPGVAWTIDLHKPNSIEEIDKLITDLIKDEDSE